MTEWPDPKIDPRSPILQRLVAADNLSEPVATLKRCLQDELTTDEIEAGIAGLVAQGVVEISNGWIYLSRSAVLASLRVELRLT